VAKPKDLTGQRFGRLVAVKMLPHRLRREVVWQFLCDCGTSVERPTGDIKRGNASSCGCLRRETSSVNGIGQKPRLLAYNESTKTHGLTHSLTYFIWGGMIQRCTNPNSKSYPRYGGRGITVCARWQSSFENFLADMGEKPDSALEIDREDNDGNYEPGNCRWVTTVVNANNRSSCRPITFNGPTQNIKEWATELGTSHAAIAYRLNNGWPVEEALTRPFSHGNKRLGLGSK
jgi:hypothetical protein